MNIPNLGSCVCPTNKIANLVISFSTQAIKSGPGSRHIYLSGQIPADASGTLIKGSVADKTIAIINNKMRVGNWDQIPFPKAWATFLNEEGTGLNKEGRVSAIIICSRPTFLIRPTACYNRNLVCALGRKWEFTTRPYRLWE